MAITAEELSKLLGSGKSGGKYTLLQPSADVEKELETLMGNLMLCLENSIKKAYKPGDNEVYFRRGDILNVCKGTPSISTDDGKYTITVSFGRSAFHESYFNSAYGPAGTDVNTLQLLDLGYTVANPAMASIDYFGKRKPGNIKSNTLDEFKRYNTIGAEVHLDFGS